MAGPSVTYTFSNSTTADATQVNQNFTDLINGATDGTKDYSISALTCAGAATFNGNVTLGNASSDDVTVTGSLASSIAIKTTYSYDLGSSTVGLRKVYMGSADSAAYTTNIVAGTLSASNTLTLPTRTGTVELLKDKSYELTNVALSCSVGSSALTVALKTKAGSDASSSDPIYIGFRSSTATSGVYTQRSVTGALSVVVSSGSTLGHKDATDHYIYVYAIDNAGTVELAVSTSLYDQGSLVSTTAEGGAGAADSNSAIYSTTARSNVPVRLIGRLKSNQTTAGTWAAVPTEVCLVPFTHLRAHAVMYGTPASATGGNPIIFPTVSRDTHNGYNTTTGRYTVPVAGVWQINATVSASPAANAAVSIYVDASAANGGKIGSLGTATQIGSGSAVLYLTAGQVVDIRVSQNTSGSQESSFSLVWLGP